MGKVETHDAVMGVEERRIGVEICWGTRESWEESLAK